MNVFILFRNGSVIEYSNIPKYEMEVTKAFFTLFIREREYQTNHIYPLSVIHTLTINNEVVFSYPNH